MPRASSFPPPAEVAIGTLLALFEEHKYNPTPIIDLGVMVAQADGRLDDGEVESLANLVEELTGTHMTREVVQYLIEASSEVLEMAGLESRARLIADILVDCDAVEPALVVAATIAMSAERERVSRMGSKTLPTGAERLRPEERSVIELVADFAGLPRPALDKLLSRVVTMP